MTLRDHTELQALTGELDSTRAFAESLRAQAHEAANRLHTTVSLVELGRPREAVEFATEELATSQRLTDQVVDAVGEPVLAALLLGKTAVAHERGVRLDIDPGTAVGTTGIPGGDLVTIVGNLLDNAIDAAVQGEPPREVRLAAWEDGGRLEVRVEDSGPGLSQAEAAQVFERGWTTKTARRRPRPRPGARAGPAGGAPERWHGVLPARTGRGVRGLPARDRPGG